MIKANGKPKVGQWYKSIIKYSGKDIVRILYEHIIEVNHEIYRCRSYNEDLDYVGESNSDNDSLIEDSITKVYLLSDKEAKELQEEILLKEI